MDALLGQATSKESKVRAEALSTILERIEKGADVSRHLDELVRICKENIPDNNPKACNTACDLVSALAQQQGQGLSSYVDALCVPLIEVLGNAKPAARERSRDALFNLMTATGASGVVDMLLSKGVRHKSWRVREGALLSYARQATDLSSDGCVNLDILASAIPSLSDAQPDVRAAACECCVAVARQVGLGTVVQRLTGSGARADRVNAVKERYVEVTGESGDAGGGTAAVPTPAPAPARSSSKGGHGARLQEQAQTERVESKPPLRAANSRQSAASASHASASMQPGAPASASATSHHPLSHAQQALPLIMPGESETAQAIAAMDDEELSRHPAMLSLTGLHSGPWWEAGIPGEGDVFGEDIGRVRPSAPPGPRELARYIEEFSSVCATTSTDWKERSAALDKLRSLLAGGLVSVDGFDRLLPRLKEPLCAQIQDLRSSIAKAACVATAELAAQCGCTHWFEPLADSLVETLSKLTVVTIAVIANSAHACIWAIMHNTRVGWPKVLPKLAAGVRSRSNVLRARCSQYLLTALRGWSTACLERHADEVQAALCTLLQDADPTARQCARLSYWSFTSAFPSRESAILSKLDANTQRLLIDDLPLARQDALLAVRTPVLPVPMLAEAPTAPIPVYGSSSTPSTAPAGQGRSVSARAGSMGAASLGSSGSVGPGGAGATPMASPMQGRQATSAAVPTTASSGSSSVSGPGGARAGSRIPLPAARASVSAAPTPTAAPPSFSPTDYAPQDERRDGYTAAFHSSSTHSTPSRPSLGATRAGSSAPAPAAAALPRPAPAQQQQAEPAPSPEPLTPEQAKELLQTAVSRFSACDALGGGLPSHAQPPAPMALDSKAVRDRAADLLNAAVRARAVDARSIVRAYGAGDKVPAAVSIPAAAISGAHASMASARGVGGAPGHVSYPPLTQPTAQLDPAGIRTMLAACNSGQVHRGIRACLSSSHEFVLMDGLSLLSTLLDTHADAYSLVVLGFGQAAMGQGVAVGADNALRFTGTPLPVVLSSSGGGPGSPALTLAPVYARCLLKGPDAEALDASTGAAIGTVSDMFRQLFTGVLQCTSGATERVCSAGKRALACMRRAYPVPALQALSLATLILDATPRVQMVCMHLIRDMLNDAGGAEYFAADNRVHRLLSKVSDLLMALTGGGGAGGRGALDSKAPSSPYYGIAELIDALVATLYAAQRQSTLLACSRLSPDQLRALMLCCDADMGGDGHTQGLHEAVFRTKSAQGAGHAAVVSPPKYAMAASAAAVGVASKPPAQPAPAPMATGIPAAGNSRLSVAPQQAQPQVQMPPTSLPSSTVGEPPLPPGFPHTIPLTRANLELVLDTMASGEKGKQLRALHYFGRSVDVTAAGSAPAGRPLAPPLHPSPTSAMMSVPPIHAQDPVWLSLLDRTLLAVLACIPQGQGEGGSSSSTSSSGGGGEPDALTMTQTALSVIRKLYRNSTGYVGGKSWAVLACLFARLLDASKEVSLVLERTLEEVVDRLPPDLALTHLIGSLTEKDGGDAAHAAQTAACLRLLTRLVPALQPGVLAQELARGRLMEGIRRAFLSTNTDVRRCTVGLLVAVHGAVADMQGTFARYVDAYLTPSQAKLLQIYIDKQV